MLQQQIKLGTRAAAKQLVNQADITAQENDNDVETGYDPNLLYPFEYMDLMFPSIDIGNCEDPAMIHAYADHQDQRKCQRQSLLDPSTHIPNNIFQGMPDSFKKWWHSAPDVDVRTFKQWFQNQYGLARSTLDAFPTKVYSFDIVPKRSVNFMDCADDVLTPKILQY